MNPWGSKKKKKKTSVVFPFIFSDSKGPTKKIFSFFFVIDPNNQKSTTTKKGGKEGGLEKKKAERNPTFASPPMVNEQRIPPLPPLPVERPRREEKRGWESSEKERKGTSFRPKFLRNQRCGEEEKRRSWGKKWERKKYVEGGGREKTDGKG